MTNVPFPRNRRVLTTAAVWALVATLALAVLAGALEDSAAVLGAATGGGIVLGFFGFGAGVVGVVATLVPDAALLVALLTYTLQVLLVGVVFVILRGSDVLEGQVSAGWLAAAIITGTLAWIGGQLFAMVRAARGPDSQAGEASVR